MITIAEPKEHIDKLWGKQKIREGETYWMMRYVLRVDHEDKVLLHNVVTGRLVVLEREEAEALETLPSPYNPVMEQLVTEHYLVPENHDEHQQVVNLRYLLRRVYDAQKSKFINKYTILPTTACNARCYYCFEHGIKSVTMTEAIAREVIRFIIDHCDKAKKVDIVWYGGEPTLMSQRIDQICEGLQSSGVEYESSIITNGYLFDENMVHRAKALWHLKSAQVSVDGAEHNHNAIKDFANISDNAYQRVIRNIGFLINEGIRVHVRMNFDLGNYQDFPILLDDLEKSGLSSHKLLEVIAAPILGEHPNKEGKVLHADDSWMDEKICELDDMARVAGFTHYGMPLPCLEYTGCSAADDSFIIIGPNGSLSKCLECVSDEHSVGTLRDGITDQIRVQSWKVLADHKKCSNCTFFPYCMRMNRCSGEDRCYEADAIRQIKYSMKMAYKKFSEKEGGNNDFQ